MDGLFDDVPRYKKKAKHISTPKAKHKHDFQPCVFEYIQKIGKFDKTCGFVPEKMTVGGYYCTVCGKIGNGNSFEWFQRVSEGGCGRRHELTPDAERELNPDTRTLPTFWLDDGWYQKYVTIGEGEQ